MCEYYLLRDVLSGQSPKLVVIDFCDFAMTRKIESGPQYEVAYSRLMESVSSRQKIDILKDIKATNENVDLINYVIPLVRYHARWTDIHWGDIFVKDDYVEYRKGAYLKSNTMKVEPNAKYYLADGLDKNGNAEPSDFAVTYYRKIAELCRSKNIQLVGLTLPNAYIPSDSKYDLIQKFCDEYDIPYLNYNSESGRELLGINFDEDFYNEGHMNINGNSKMSKELAKIFHEQYGLEDHRNDAAYASWNEDWNAFYADFEKFLK